MNVITMKTLLGRTTAVFSKGPETERLLEAMGVPVALRQLLPPEAEAGGNDLLEVVDCDVLTIGVNMDQAAASLGELQDLLHNCNDFERTHLREGVSYKFFTQLLGDDIAALQLMALGEATGLWGLLGPAALGVPDAVDRGAAVAVGYLYMSGYPGTAVRAAVC